MNCKVPDCKREAYCEVLLYDVYPYGSVFLERDYSCSYLCTDHMIENEERAEGIREPRGRVFYPFTNRGDAQGFSIYRPLSGGGQGHE